MAAKQTVGARFEAEGKKKSPLKTAVQIAAEEKSAAAEKFPTDLKAAFALLAEINAEPVDTQDEWDEKQPRLKALKAHIHQLQQGLPLLETKSGDVDHAHMIRVTNAMKLDATARAHPEVAAVIAERDALAKELAALKAPKE